MRNKPQITFTVIEQLELFLARVDEIRDCQLIKKGFKSSFSFNSNLETDTFEILSFEPNEDDLRSFLTIYRKFISKGSPIFINIIFNICLQHLNNDQLRNNLVKVRKCWNEAFQKGFISLNLNQKQYSPEEIMNLWINAVYFHDDSDKIKHLESLMSDAIFYTVIRQSFFSILSETTRQILYVGSVIKTGFNNKHFDFAD
jgi:hypothetical protein